MKRVCEEFSGSQAKEARVRTIRREIYAEKLASKTAIRSRALRPSCRKTAVPMDSGQADGENVAFFVNISVVPGSRDFG